MCRFALGGKNNDNNNLHVRQNKQTRCRAALGGVLVAQQCVGNLATPALGPCWLPLCHCPPLLCHLPSSHLNDLLSNIVKHHRDVLCAQLYNLLPQCFHIGLVTCTLCRSRLYLTWVKTFKDVPGIAAFSEACFVNGTAACYRPQVTPSLGVRMALISTS